MQEATHVGHGKVNRVFITVTDLITVKTIAVSMATTVTVTDVRVTWECLSVMRYLPHKSTPVAKESVAGLYYTTVRACARLLSLSFYKVVNYII